MGVTSEASQECGGPDFPSFVRTGHAPEAEDCDVRRLKRKRAWEASHLMTTKYTEFANSKSANSGFHQSNIYNEVLLNCNNAL